MERKFCGQCEYFGFNHPEKYLSFNFGWMIEHADACKCPEIVTNTAECVVFGGNPKEINKENHCSYFLMYKKPIKKKNWFQKLFNL